MPVTIRKEVLDGILSKKLTITDVLLTEDNFVNFDSLEKYAIGVSEGSKSFSDVKIVYYIDISRLDLVDYNENLKNYSYVIVCSLTDIFKEVLSDRAVTQLTKLELKTAVDGKFLEFVERELNEQSQNFN